VGQQQKTKALGRELGLGQKSQLKSHWNGLKAFFREEGNVGKNQVTSNGVSWKNYFSKTWSLKGKI